MGIFDKLFAGRNKKKKPGGDYSQYAQDALFAFLAGEGEADIKKRLLEAAGGDGRKAEEAFWFLPCAVFTSVYPHISKVDGAYLVITKDGRSEERLFADSGLYEAITLNLALTAQHMDKSLRAKILSYSNEYATIQQMQKDGEDIKNIQIQPVFLSSYD